MTDTQPLILLVDDDPAILLTVGDYIESNGFRVTRCRSAEEGLTAAEKTSPDLIVLDIAMPGAGGLSFLNDILTPDRHLRYPVLVFTAHKELGTFFDGTPVDGLLPKTADPGTLLNEIRRILGRRPRQSKAAVREAKPRLAILENDPLIGERLLAFFGQVGYEVSLFLDPNDCLEAVTARQPDALLVKCTLPMLDGPTVASLLARMSRTRNVPVFLYDTTGRHSRKPDHPNVRDLILSSTPGAIHARMQAAGLSASQVVASRSAAPAG